MISYDRNPMPPRGRVTPSRIFFVALLGVGLGACAVEPETPSPTVDAVSSEVMLAASDQALPFTVDVSDAAAAQLENLHGESLDAKEIDGLVTERVREVIDAGELELSGEPGAAYRVFVDVKHTPPGAQRPDYQADCWVYNGVVCFEYTVDIQDGAGCRYYVQGDCYDWFSNYCTGDEVLFYSYSYIEGPYYYQCPGEPADPPPTCPGCAIP